LREGAADAAILGFAVAPCHAAQLPKIATPFGLAMTGMRRRARDDRDEGRAGDDK
jgi:hypothetical protein